MSPFDEYVSLLTSLGYDIERLRNEPKVIVFYGEQANDERVQRLIKLTTDHMPAILEGSAA